jgi:molybdate transport system substrate-binding protein
VRTTLVTLLLLATPASACAERRELTVFAAASLREVFEDLGRAHEARTPGLTVRLSFAGSQELRVQIEHGARADVFASADLEHMAALEEAGRVEAPRIFARNAPVVVVPADNPAGLAAFADLPRARRVVLGAPAVPIGAYTERILDRAGADFKRRVLARVVSRELNTRQVLAKVALGEADAGVVYRTDAAAATRVRAIPIPDDLNVLADYPVAALKDAPQAAAAGAFVDLLLSPEGQKRLAAAGFLVAR